MVGGNSCSNPILSQLKLLHNAQTQALSWDIFGTLNLSPSQKLELPMMSSSKSLYMQEVPSPLIFSSLLCFGPRGAPGRRSQCQPEWKNVPAEKFVLWDGRLLLQQSYSRLIQNYDAKWTNPGSLATTRESCFCHLPWKVLVKT